MMIYLSYKHIDFKTIRTVFSLLLAIVAFSALPSSVHGAVLTLDPASASIPVGNTMVVKILIDTEGEPTTSTDAIIQFDGNVLQATSIVNGDNGESPFFPDFFQSISPGEMYIGASVIDPIDTRTGSGVLATVTFTGVADGVSDVRFDCTAGKTSDTNISKSDKNATDIVDCSRLTSGRYTVGVGIGGPTATPAESAAYYPQATPAATTPVTGSTETTFSLLGIGLLFILVAVGTAGMIKVG